MKEIFLTILSVCLVLFSLFAPFRYAYLDNQPKTITVGPNQTYDWTSGQTFTRSVEGTFSLKSDAYFEVKYDQVIVQAAYEAPVLGEEEGLYWIRDLPMSGTWTTSASATIFSLEKTTISLTATFWYEFTNYLVAVFFCFVFLVISLIIVVWFDSILS